MSYKDSNDSYFTAGELANLFGISKQTLLYYDKIDLLSPDFVCEKGYRHYSIQQYLDLEIIVNLRSFNISIADIKAYLTKRSKNDFMNLVTQKKQECMKVIKENEAIIKSLNVIYNNAKTEKPYVFNKPLLTFQEERLLRVTKVSEKDDGKDRIILFTRHAQTAFHSKKSLEKHMGWIISQEDLFVEKNSHPTKAYFSFVPNTPGHKSKSKIEVLPAGLFLEIYFKGTYYENFSSLVDIINNFMELNELEAVGDIYILTIENHLFYTNTDDYTNKIFLAVKKK